MGFVATKSTGRALRPPPTGAEMLSSDRMRTSFSCVATSPSSGTASGSRGGSSFVCELRLPSVCRRWGAAVPKPRICCASIVAVASRGRGSELHRHSDADPRAAPTPIPRRELLPPSQSAGWHARSSTGATRRRCVAVLVRTGNVRGTRGGLHERGWQDTGTGTRRTRDSRPEWQRSHWHNVVSPSANTVARCGRWL